MEKPSDGTNIFLPLDKTPQFQDSTSKNLFGGTSSLQTSKQENNTMVSSTLPASSLSSNIFGNSSKDFESSSSSTAIFGAVTKEEETQNNFRNPSATSVTSGSIFGQVAPLSSSSLFQAKPSTISSSSQQLDFKSVSGKSFHDHATKSYQPSASTQSENLGSGSSVMFTLQSRDATNLTDNIFGGERSQSSSLFKNQQDKPSSTISNELSYSLFGNKDQTFPKPERVFADAAKVSDSKPFAFESLKNKSFDKQSTNIFQRPTAADKNPIDFLNAGSKVQSTARNVALESSLLIACDIPEKFLDKSVLINHFAKFGTVERVHIKKGSNQALIYFSDCKSAQKAKAKGKCLHPLLPEMKLFFGSQQQSPQLKKPTDDRSPSQIRKRDGNTSSIIKRDDISAPKIMKRENIDNYRMTKRDVISPPMKMKKQEEFTTVISPPMKKQEEFTTTPLRKRKDDVDTLPVKKKLETNASPKLTKPVIKRPFSPRSGSPYGKVLNSGTTKSISEKSVTSSKPSLTFPVKTEIKSKAPSGNIGTIKDFSVLMRTQAKNNYDKFLILDARDKTMRAKKQKVSDLNKAHYLLATCPDMCPEKERFSRDIQYDISAYEMTNNEMNHKLTVKKFSRSSADKDEPLPHELRPGPVLKMTMDFLLCNIVQKGDSNNVQVDLWYNYLCNRTRALRSDIMQQHLIDSNAVYVLERCIRFHIHCSHHLCEESPEYFEAKINSEHLSKSLHSLNELYHDLDERGYYFENESEFRAYDILLNINDGNVIFKYLKFKDAIRNSIEVQFAVKVLHSVRTNNYSRFFKLLNESEYLQACIIYRYFSFMRLKALDVIMKAYSSQLLPVDKIMNMLGVTIQSEFQDYIQHFGIEINEDSKVLINKGNFATSPESRPPTLRSNIIIAKKNFSINEIINNGPLPENPLVYYRSHCSFNSKGILNEEALNASDQRVVLKSESPLETKKFKMNKEDLEITKIEREIMKKVDKMRIIKMLGRYFAFWKNFVNFQSKIKVLAEKWRVQNARKYLILWRDIAQKEALLNKKADEHLLTRYFRKWKIYIDNTKKMKSLIQKVRNIEDTILLRKYVGMWKCKVHYLRSEKRAKSARNYVLAYKYLKKWISHNRDKRAVRKCDKYYSYKLLKNSFQRWKSWHIMEKNKNIINVESFSAISSLLSLEDQNRLLSWGYERNNQQNLSAHDIAKLDEDILSKIRKHHSIEKLSNIVAWTALPLVLKFQSDVLTQSPDFSRNPFYSYFKILLLIDPDTDDYLLEWIRTKFNILEYEDISKSVQCQYHFTSPHNEVTYVLIVSEEKLIYSNAVDGSSLVLIVGNENKLEKLRRYAQSLRETPVLILCSNRFNECLSKNLWQMTKKTIDNPFVSEKLLNFVMCQWQNRKSRFILQINKCKNILNNFIFDKVLSPVNKEVSRRHQYGQASLEPSKVVSFYNSAISHILSCFEKTKSQTRDWPGLRELSPNKSGKQLWNRKGLEVSITFLQEACLPLFNIQLSHSWCQIEADLTTYMKKVIAPLEYELELFSEVRTIIKESRKKFYEDKFYGNGNVNTDKFWYCIPWIEILNCFILFKLSRLPDINIAYNFSDLEAFDCVNYWVSELRTSEVVIPTPTKETPAKRKATELAPKVDLKKIRSDSRLLQDIENEKQKMLEYEKHLESLMVIEEDLSLLFPET